VVRSRAALGRAGGEDLYALQLRLRDVMWEQVGLVRSGAGLRRALAAIEDIGARLDGIGVGGGPEYNLAWQDWLNLENQSLTAWLIARSALERAESRGSHYRSDHPAPGANLHHVRVQLTAEGPPRIWIEPVRLTRWKPDARSARPLAVEVGD
jgi:fumarate reductase flavoprotein subunit